MASIRDVAKLANVSTASVSNVINQTKYVSPEIVRRVEAAMKEINYQPNLVARGLRSKKTGIIGVLIPDIDNFYFLNVAQGVESLLEQNGYTMILANSGERFANEKEKIRMLLSRGVDGLLMVPTNNSCAYLNDLLEPDFPIVFMDRRPKEFYADSVTLDNYTATVSAITHFIERGHTRIGIITGNPWLTTTLDRLQGYEYALKRAGLAPADSLIKHGNFKFESGYALAKQLVLEGNATAIFTADSSMAVGAIACLNDLGIGIPDKVAVIGCNDYKWTLVTKPTMSVISQPSFELGEQAAQLLLRRIKECAPSHRKPLDTPDRKTFSAEEVKIATHLIVRESG